MTGRGPTVCQSVAEIRDLELGKKWSGKFFFFTLSKIRPPSRDLQNAVGPDVRRSVAEIRDLKVGKKWLKTNFFLLFLKFVLPLGTSKMSSDPMPVRRRDTGPQSWKKMVKRNACR